MGQRILLVTRRFWPLCGAEESQLVELSSAWREAGASVSIVTPQWDRTWPTRVVLRDMSVTRLAYAPKRLWGGYWYLRRLNHWLRSAISQFDLILVWRMQLDALVAIRVGQDMHIPVVLLYEGCGAAGDNAWIRNSPYGQRVLAACKKASAVLTFDSASHEEALRLAIEPGICHLVRGIYPSAEKPRVTRESARMHLLESNRDFFSTPGTPVGLTISPLEDRAAMTQLFAAWSKLRRNHVDARLWWIGDGTKRTSLYAMLGDHDLRYHGVLPGEFDDGEDLLAAADFYVAMTTGAAKSVPRALAFGLPVFAADLPDIRGMIPASAPVRYFRTGDVESLARMFCQVCDAPEETRRWRRQTADWAEALDTPSEIALEHLAIMSRLGYATR